MFAHRLLAGSVGIILLVVLFGPVPGSEAAQNEYAWYEVDAARNVKVNLYVFWSERCGHCPPAIEFAEALKKRRPWVNVLYYEISRNPANRDLYHRMAASVGQVAGQTPGLLYCKEVQVGFFSADTTGAKIERSLVRWYEILHKHYNKPAVKEKASARLASPTFWSLVLLVQEPPLPPIDPLDELLAPPDIPPEEPVVEVPGFGELKASSLSLPALTVVLAGCDAFNPCAFFVLLFLLSILLHGHSRWRMLLVGSLFVFSSGLVYFLFMAAWLNLFFLLGHLDIITTTAAVVAVVISLVNIKDYFWFKQGVSLSIPESARPTLQQRMVRLMRQTSVMQVVIGTLILATLVNLYELLCTSGFPMVYTRVLTLRQLPPSSYYLYLLLYNVIYVLPLAGIVLAFSLTLGGHKLSEFEGRILKLLSGLMMLELGLLLLIVPTLLNTLVGAVGMLVSAIVFTALIVLGDLAWRRLHRRPDQEETPPHEKPHELVHGGTRDH